MDKIKQWWQAHRPSKRRLIQVYAALLYNAHLTGFANGQIYTGASKVLCVPGLNCYSCPGAVGACPLGALQNALAASATRTPAYVLGILLLFGLTLGRTVCGFLCPVGLAQELLHKLPTPKLKKSRVTRLLSWVKYGILAVFAVLLPLAYALRKVPLPAFCKYICPAGTLEGAVALLLHPANADKLPMLDGLFTGKLVIAVLIVTAAIFIYRAFCRFLCPLGALYSLFAKVSLLGVTATPDKCVACGACTSHCPMDVRRVGDHECIHCGGCISVCPTKAIAWKGGRVFLQGHAAAVPEKRHPLLRRCLAWGAALAVLGGVLWAVNQPAVPVPAPVGSTDDTPVGKELGMRCPDFTLPRCDTDGSFALTEAAGRVTVINFWATWCAPCVKELPHFEQLQAAYPDDVTVVAIHSNLVTEDVAGYLAERGWALPFLLDTDGAVIASLGGGTMLPMTVVLDRSGHIVYNQVGSVTYAQLEAIILPLL